MPFPSRQNNPQYLHKKIVDKYIHVLNLQAKIIINNFTPQIYS